MSRGQFLCWWRYLVLAIVLVSLPVLLIPVSVVKAADEVNFPDPNLRAAIISAVGKQSSDDILQSDLNGLLTLDASSRGIVNLAGLEHCTSLIWVRLNDNQISNLSPLAGLTSLTQLYLDGNQISDLSPLSGLTGLTWLYLGDNQISNLLPLAGLTSLWGLYLYSNQISDLLPLSGLTGLMALHLYGNQISDLSPLSGLTNLSELLLFSNQISNLSPLSGLTGLTVLYLYSNQISNLSPLSGLTSLVNLGLSFNQISNLSPLSGLTNLTELGLNDNQIGDIQPLVNNSGLSTGDQVFLTNNPLSYTSVYTYIPQLQARGATVNFDASPAGNTPAGSPVTVSLSGITVTFNSVSVAGNTTVTQESAPCGSLPSGYMGRGLVQHITTTATHSGPVTVAISYDPSGILTEGDMRLFHCDGTNWKNVTTSVDTGANIIHGSDSTLSWWWIGDPPDPSAGGGGATSAAPAFPSIYVGIGAALGAGILAYFVRRRMAKA